MLALRITVNETTEARILGHDVVFKHPGHTVHSSELTDLLSPDTQQVYSNITLISLAPFPVPLFADALSGQTICNFQGHWWIVTSVNVEEESVALFLVRDQTSHQYVVPRDAFVKKKFVCPPWDDLVLQKK